MSLALFRSADRQVKILGPSWRTPRGTIVETDGLKATATAMRLGLVEVQVDDWLVNTDPESPGFGSSEKCDPLAKPESDPELPQLTESDLAAVEDCVPIIPGAITGPDVDPGLFEALSAIASTDDPDSAEQRIWESSDESPPPSDPELWDGAGANYELDEQDMLALAAIRDGEIPNANSLSIVVEAGMVSGEPPRLTDFGREWLDRMTAGPRDDELADALSELE